MLLHRYNLACVFTTASKSEWVIIRERYLGRDWPWFWRARWAYDGCIGTFPTYAEAGRAMRLLPGVVRDMMKVGE